MRINEGDIVKTLQPGMNTRFFKGVSTAPRDWTKVADFVNSSQQTETYPWLGGMPDPVLFEGERKARKFAEYSWAIANAEYEQTIAIKRSTLDDDQYGQLNNMAQRLGAKFGKWTNKKISSLLPLTATTVGYDGQYIVDVDHQEGKSSTQSNKGTTALSASTYAIARSSMVSF